MIVLRTALRALRHAPGFTATAILVLGLGLGANIILFNAVHALLWRPLPFPAPDRLVSLQHTTRRGRTHVVSSGRNAADLREHVPAVAAVGLVEGSGPLTLALGSDRTVDLDSAGVNSDYLAALALRPVVGRFFGEEDDQGRAGETRALLAESAWRRHFDADPGVAGRLVTFLDGADRRQLRIVGVYPDGVTLPYVGTAALLTPIAWRHADIAGNRGNMLYRTVVRLKRGIDLGQASAQAGAALRASELEVPERQRGDRASFIPLRSALVSSHAPAWLLYAAAGLLLMLTATNVASLFLARALGRRHEAAVRQALGASFGHTLREQLAEAVVVCAGGLGLALTLNEWAQSLVPRLLPELRQVGPELLATSWPLVAFGVGTSLLVACSLAALPVLQARRAGLLGGLTEGGRSATARNRWQGVLASAQLALILVLLALGSLLGRSFVQALRTDPGFDPANVLTFRASIPGGPDARTAAACDLAAVIRSMPGTRAVGFSAEPPLGDYYAASHSTRPGPFTASDPSLAFRMVGPGYFQALGVRLRRGRALTEDEVRRGSDVVMLNESAARLLFEGADPIDRQVHSGFGGAMFTVVGVVGDVRSSGLDREAPPMLYRPYRPFFGSDVVFTVRTARAADEYIPALQARVKTWNAGVIVREAAPLDGELRKTVASRLRAAGLVGGFALLGLLVGCVGLYGTIAAHVQRLRRELGIRMAFGASAASVRGRVLAHGARLVAAGTIVGVAASAAAAALIRKQLYGIEPFDVASFALALVLLAAGALAASLVPALRASRINPIDALRQE